MNESDYDDALFESSNHNTLRDLCDYFGIKFPEFAIFWASLSWEEKLYYRTTSLS